MYFSKITLSESYLRQPDAGDIFQSPYKLHQSVWRLFADSADRKRDFLYRLEGGAGKMPVVYSISARLPEPDGTWDCNSKEYLPKITADTALSFKLRANPIRSKRDEKDKQHRHDVVMEAKDDLKRRGVPKEQWPTSAQIIQESGYHWLSARAEKNGFIVTPERVRVDGYQQNRFYKPKGSHYVNVSTLEFEGVLTVTDPELFASMLFQGLGSAKGFGCGLMLVKRP